MLPRGVHCHAVAVKHSTLLRAEKEWLRARAMLTDTVHKRVALLAGVHHQAATPHGGRSSSSAGTPGVDWWRWPPRSVYAI